MAAASLGFLELSAQGQLGPRTQEHTGQRNLTARPDADLRIARSVTPLSVFAVGASSGWHLGVSECGACRLRYCSPSAA